MKTKKQFTEEILDYLNPKQIDYLYKVVETFMYNAPLVSQVIELTDINDKMSDYSLPQSFFDLLTSNNVEPDFYVWNYEDDQNGHPVNIAEEFFTKFKDTISAI